MGKAHNTKRRKKKVIYPFVKEPLPVDFETAGGVFKAYRLLKERGYDRLSKEEKEFVASFFSELSRPEAYREGIYRRVGWAVNFRPFLRKFLVNIKYDGWSEEWSFNSTTLRKISVRPQHNLEFIKIPKRKA